MNVIQAIGIICGLLLALACLVTIGFAIVLGYNTDVFAAFAAEMVGIGACGYLVMQEDFY